MLDRNGIQLLAPPRKRLKRRKDVHLDEGVLFVLQGGTCFYCECTLTNFTRDHFYPRSAGNSLYGNMVLACRCCNHEKNDRQPTPEEVRKFEALYAG